MNKTGLILVFRVLVIFMVTALVLTGTAMGEVSREGLVAEWHFDGDAKDSSGNGNDGTIHGATFVNGISGNALSFDGTNDYVDCGNIISNFDQFTFSAWIKIKSFTHIRYMGIFGQQEFAFPRNANSWMFYTSPNAFGSSSFWNDGTYIESRVDHDLPFNEWHYIVQTYDGSNIKQYDNGELINSVSYPNKILSNNQDFIIGKVAAYPSYGLSTNFFDGIIDEIYVYNRALSADEVKASYEAVSKGTTQPSTPVSTSSPAQPASTTSQQNSTQSTESSNPYLYAGIGGVLILLLAVIVLRRKGSSSETKPVKQELRVKPEPEKPAPEVKPPEIKVPEPETKTVAAVPPTPPKPANEPPNILVSITSSKGFKVGIWEKLDINILNVGEGIAKDIEIRLSGPIETSGNKVVAVLDGKGGQTDIVIGVKPKDPGNIPLKVEVVFFDSKDKSYRMKEEAFISVAKESETISMQQMPVINIGSYVGEHVDRSTKIIDSMVQRSNIGAGGNKKCSNCGREVNANEKFCLECGDKLGV